MGLAWLQPPRGPLNYGDPAGRHDAPARRRVLSLAMERGAPFILAADPPGAGKTTILTSLLAFAPPEASVYFTRGWGETFDLPPLARASRRSGC